MNEFSIMFRMFPVYNYIGIYLKMNGLLQVQVQVDDSLFDFEPTNLKNIFLIPKLDFRA